MKILKWILKILKRLFLFLIKEIASFFIKLCLFFIILFGILGVIFQNQMVNIFNEENKKNEIRITKDTYININLGEKFSEKTLEKNFLNEDNVSFHILLNCIERISSSENIKGIILKLDNVTLNYAQLEEISKELSNLKKNNKKIIAFAENVNRKNWYLMSFADRICMPKTHSTTVNIYPYFKENFYKKDLLDKLGIKVNIINTGSYKSYGEDFSKSHMSKEAREDITRILNDNYENSLNTISINYGYDKKELDNLIKKGELVAVSSEELFNKKLINEYKYWNELINDIGEKNIINLQEYINTFKMIEKKYSNNKIYVLILDGEIGDGEIVDDMFINSGKVIKEIEKVEKDKSIKGIILRINSPGGSALTSDKIANKIKELRANKPVYVSMGGVVASGGYYIAANASKIYANENTITGSIGVVSMIPNFSKLLNKVGVNNEKINLGKFSDLYSTDEMNEEKYNKILSSNLNVYNDFLKVVSEGRKIKIDKLKKIAGGRVWTGREGVYIGLVDEIGGLKDTISGMATDIGISEDYTVIFSQEKLDIKNIFQKYYKVLKIDNRDQSIKFITDKFYNKEFLNKPIMYMPYDILEYLF